MIHVVDIHPTKAGRTWRITARVTNGRDTWIEVGSYHRVSGKEAEASFINYVLGMGWTVVE